MLKTFFFTLVFFSGLIFSDAPGWTFKRPVDVQSENIWVENWIEDYKYIWEIKDLASSSYIKLNFDFIYTDYTTQISFETDDIFVDALTGEGVTKSRGLELYSYNEETNTCQPDYYSAYQVPSTYQRLEFVTYCLVNPGNNIRIYFEESSSTYNYETGFKLRSYQLSNYQVN